MPSDDAVRLSNGEVVEPDNVAILESGWVLCRFDRTLVRYPPRRVECVDTCFEGHEVQGVESGDE